MSHADRHPYSGEKKKKNNLLTVLAHVVSFGRGTIQEQGELLV